MTHHTGLKIEAEDLKITDLTDMKQLEYLSRISVMAASIAGQGHSDYTNYCFTAYGYIHRMWQVSRNFPYNSLITIIQHLATNQ